MELYEVDKGFFVGGQIMPLDIEILKTAGFQTVICNRPDGEDAAASAFKTIAEIAHEKGVDIYYLPVLPGHVGLEDVQKMKALLINAKRPIFAYCRSGARSRCLYQLATGKA